MKTKLIGAAVIAVFVAVGCGKNEGKKREAAMSIAGDMVAIPEKNFKMGKHEVTQAQWEAVMGSNPSAFKGADLPVESVSWDDCQDFIKKLNVLPEVKGSGWTYR